MTTLIDILIQVDNSDSLSSDSLETVLENNPKKQRDTTTQIDELLIAGELTYQQIATQVGCPTYSIGNRARNLQEQGIIEPRKRGKRALDYSETDELLIAKKLTYQQIATQVGYSTYSIDNRARKLQEQGIIEPRKRGRRALDYSETDELLIAKKLTYQQIATQVGYSTGRIGHRAKKLQEQKRIEPRPRGKPANPELQERNTVIINDALTGDYTLEELGTNYKLTRERIRQILSPNGIHLREIRQTRRHIQIEETELFGPTKKSLVDIIAQHCFNKIVQEEGFEYALAWRLKRNWQGINAKGTKYTETEIAALIKARLETNPKTGKPIGYSLALINAGWIPDNKTAKDITPTARKLLESALHDVNYQKPNIKFGERKYFTTSEEIKTFKRLIGEGKSKTEIAKELGIPLASIYYHKNRLNL